MHTVISWNVASLAAILRKDPSLLSKLVVEQEADVLCLQETKLQNKAVAETDKVLGLEGWHKFYNCSTDRLGHSGTLIATKYEPLSIKYGINSPALDRSGRAVTVELQDVYVVNVYVLNSGPRLINLKTRLTAWDPALAKYVTSLTKKKPVILCGDLNVAVNDIDVYDPKRHRRSPGFTDEERSSFKKYYLNLGWCDAYRKNHPEPQKGYTFFSKRGFMRPKGLGWRLDYFLLSPEIARSRCECSVLSHLPDVSDHLPIVLSKFRA